MTSYGQLTTNSLCFLCCWTCRLRWIPLITLSSCQCCNRGVQLVALLSNGLNPAYQTGPSRCAFWVNHLSHKHWALVFPRGLFLDPYYYSVLTPLAEISWRHNLGAPVLNSMQMTVSCMWLSALHSSWQRFHALKAVLLKWGPGFTGHKLKMNDGKTVILQVLPRRDTHVTPWSPTADT